MHDYQAIAKKEAKLGVTRKRQKVKDKAKAKVRHRSWGSLGVGVRLSSRGKRCCRASEMALPKRR